ncbi:NAD(+)/NADH kinase [Candidatus Micrarchaeota archaeon]|nr:NAD(+)/NADH kinase [Candidatus Micrarchaeota archaeon]
MLLAVVSKWRRRIRREVRSLGFETTRLRPDVVACVGGDGTLLLAEQKFPGVPKLFIYHKCAKKCTHSPLEKYWKLLRERKYVVVKSIKLEARVGGRVLHAINDVNIHYLLPQAVGLRVSAGRRRWECLGDGVVISTPFGSTAYFKAITRKTFSRGIGLAFNHPIKPTTHAVLPENSRMVVEVVRGRGLLACDANPRIVYLSKGDRIIIRKAREPARFVLLQGMPFRVVVSER